MPIVKHLSRIAFAWLAGSALNAGAAETEFNPVAREPRHATAHDTAGVIFKLRGGPAGASLMKLSTGTERIEALSKRTGLDMSLKREISGSLLATTVDLGDASPDQVLERLRADPAVEFAVPDRRRYVQATPNDPLFAGQWYLKNSEVSAVNAVAAWDRELGRSGVVVAVLDTGVLYDHPDLGRGDAGGKVLPGFDFVSINQSSNDGDLRDSNPTDPGDWVSDSDKAGNLGFANCDVTASSWHGTRVAGMIGARTNNSAGITGLSWNSFILPVRVLGKCGGVDSDILAGMRWAAGLTVAGATANATPARILNMSLGSTGPCEQSYASVIDELTALKVLVVISAGNEGTMVTSPANCTGVAAVAALRHAGSKVGFSNLGTEVTLGAPGGNCVNINGGPCLFSLDTTSNIGDTGATSHIYTDQFNSNLGTSFSAPIVSGIAALMLSRNANLSTSQMLARLREGAVPFPTAVAGEAGLPTCHVPLDTSDVQLEQCLCTLTTCGAGMANAANSVNAADRPIAAIAVPASVSAGQDVSLDAAASAAACGRSVASFAWVVVEPALNPPAIVGASTSTATVVAPGSGAIVLRVTVTDDQGRTDAANVTVESTRALSDAPASAGSGACAAPVTSGTTPGAPPPTAPPTQPSSGGRRSGGSFDLVALGLLGLVLAARIRRRRHVHFFRCI
jgi:serine protease